MSLVLLACVLIRTQMNAFTFQPAVRLEKLLRVRDRVRFTVRF